MARPSKNALNQASRVPSYLEETPWLEYEQHIAMALSLNLRSELKKLKHKLTSSRVHNTRVALRRWGSVWAVLRQDGWKSSKFKSKVAQKLSALLEALGELRDWDVSIEQGKRLKAPDRILKSWARQREHIIEEVQTLVDNLDTNQLIRQLTKHLVSRPNKIRAHLQDAPLLVESAYHHLDSYLTAQEKQVQELDFTAHSPQDLHQLRLAIKRWRYLLTEFFGLTNLSLVQAQQILGKLNDLTRLQNLLADEPQLAVMTRIKAENRTLRGQLRKIREELPYGLRPVHISTPSTTVPRVVKPQ